MLNLAFFKFIMHYFKLHYIVTYVHYVFLVFKISDPLPMMNLFLIKAFPDFNSQLHYLAIHVIFDIQSQFRHL